MPLNSGFASSGVSHCTLPVDAFRRTTVPFDVPEIPNVARPIPLEEADKSGRWVAIAQVRDADAEIRVPGRGNRDSVRPGSTENREPSGVRGRGVGDRFAGPYVRAVAEVEEDANLHRGIRECGRGETHDEEECRGSRGSPPSNQPHLNLLLKYV